MEPDLVVRPARPADRAALGRLGALLVRLHYDFDPKRFVAPRPHTAEGYGSWLVQQSTETNIIVLVAARGDEVVGYAYAGLEGYDYMALRGPAGALYDIIVDPVHRGHGIGRSLLDATLEALAARGAPRVVLSTATQNEAAQRLFARAGFRPTMIEMTRELD
jgi:ribosomal protein S18 acetylase RimI-like enzyme